LGFSISDRKISKITIHHAAGVISGANLLAWGNHPKNGGSFTYGIGNDGVIVQHTDEKNRPWTSSSPWNDYQAITIEVGNSASNGEWPISAAAMKSLIALCVDVCKRNNIPKLEYDGTRDGSLTLHEMFAATGCPGAYIKKNLTYICNEVNKGIGAVVNPPTINTAIKNDDIVTINSSAVYGGQSSARGRPVPDVQCAPKRHTVMNTATNNSVLEARLREINSWVAVSSLTKVSSTNSNTTQPTTPAPPASNAPIKKGEFVAFRNPNATVVYFGTSTAIPIWVRSGTWRTENDQPANGRIVLGRNPANTQNIQSPVNASLLMRV
jgi:hypothetical protein